MISDKKFENLRRLALKKSGDCASRCKHITFILSGSKVISVGINRLRTDSFAYKLYKYPFIHSEVDAIKRAPRGIDLSRCTLVNFRVARESDELLMSKPCLSCSRLLDSYGFRHVYYTINNELVKL